MRRPAVAFQSAGGFHADGDAHLASCCPCLPVRRLLPAPASEAASMPAADYVTAGQDEPGYRAWISANPVRPTTGQGVQRLSRRRMGRRGGPDMAVAAHRERLAEMRRAAVRGAADRTLAEYRPALRYIGACHRAGGRRGRGRVGLSQPVAQRLRRRAPRQRPSDWRRDRHGAAAADDPRSADGKLCGVHAGRGAWNGSALASTRGCGSTSMRANFANGARRGAQRRRWLRRSPARTAPMPSRDGDGHRRSTGTPAPPRPADALGPCVDR